MNKKHIIITLIILIITTGTFFIYLPKIKELQIKNEINKANYCSINSDCQDAGGKCPFGCYIFVNKNEVEKTSKLINSYNSNCVYDCVGNITPICKNNKCVANNLN